MTFHNRLDWQIWYLHIFNSDSLIVRQNSTSRHCIEFNASILYRSTQILRMNNYSISKTGSLRQIHNNKCSTIIFYTAYHHSVSTVFEISGMGRIPTVWFPRQQKHHRDIAGRWLFHTQPPTDASDLLRNWTLVTKGKNRDNKNLNLKTFWCYFHTELHKWMTSGWNPHHIVILITISHWQQITNWISAWITINIYYYYVRVNV